MHYYVDTNTKYKILRAFDKKFNDVAKAVEKEYKDCGAEKEALEKECKDLWDDAGNLREQIEKKVKAKDHYNRKVNEIKKLKIEFDVFIDEVNNRGSKVERNFYSKYNDLLKKIKRDGKKSDSEITEITGHPWTIYGTKEEKERLKKAKSLFEKLFYAYTHPESQWDSEDDEKLDKLNKSFEQKNEQYRRKSWKCTQKKAEYEQLSRDVDDVIAHFRGMFNSVRKSRSKKIESATQAFIKKHGRQPRRPVLTDVLEK